ncbi:Protein TyrC [Acetobacteraceae bacterium EV16G]|uniref:Protein TyrC n=1 Tax=Sorlinia euscelidii TaxID=3081148 RepID=A0ABU7TZ17_9PROT
MAIYNKICILGIGLIGASILRGVREKPGIAAHSTAYDIAPDVVVRARALGLADFYAPDIAASVKDADCVVICTPVSHIAETARFALPHMKPGATLTDVGSTRQSVIADIAPYLREDISYIPAHPMAGTEFSGPEAGFAALFENRWCLVTPTSQAKKPDVDRLVSFWQALGAKTRMMEASEHDRICAIVSHLPHLIAFTICDTADKMSETYRTAVLDYAASGFKDFTRIAGSDPVMWRDIFLSNKDAILETLARFQDDVEDLARAIRDDDEARIIDAIERGRRIRKSLVDSGEAQDSTHLTAHLPARPL